MEVMGIEFHSETQQSTFYSPLAEFDQTTNEIDIRIDPLTGRHTRIVSENFLVPDTNPDIADVVESGEDCFFCPGSVGEVTPTYDDFVGMDRGSVGQATSFPNLHPYGSHSNVIALTSDHYRPLSDFSGEVFRDGFAAAMEYIEAVQAHDPDAAYASVNMNYLRPAGSSIVHPHMQTLIDDRGTATHRRMARAAAEYEGDYWSDLLAALPAERVIGRSETMTWFAPFAPTHHLHVRGVAPAASIPAAGDPLLDDLGEGIAATLEFYGGRGLNSFNMATYLGPGPDPDADSGSTPVVVDVIARSVFDTYYWSDSPFFAVLHDEPVIDEAPEEYGPAAADYW